MKKLHGALAAALVLGASGPAAAASLQIKDGNGTLRSFDFFQDGSGNYFGTLGIWGLLGDYQADVNSSHQLLVTGPVTNAGTFAVQAAQSGTWTIQPGNTANTTAWLVTGTGGTFPATESGAWNITNVSGTVSLPTGAATSALQTTGNTALTTINTTLGTPMQNSGGTVTVTQGTAANLNMTCANCSGASATDNGGFTASSSIFAPLGGVYFSTATANPVTASGDWAAAQLTHYRALQTDWYNSSGTEMGTSGSPVQVSLANTAANATAVTVGQATAASLNATVVGTGTFAAQLTGATNNINNVSGTVSLPTGASTSANQTNASQKTQIVDGSGNVIASTSNNLDVQCANCSGSGVSTADGATWSAGSSLFAGVGGAYQTSATSNPLTAGDQGFAQLTHYRALMSDWYNSSGTEMGTSGSPVQVSLANTGSNGTAVAISDATVGGSVGSLLGGTAGTTSLADAGVYQSTAPTLTTGQQAALSLTSRGMLQVSPIFGTTLSSTAAGAVGAATQRIAVGQDTTTIAGSAPGTAGTASANVVTVQGIASMTAVKVDGSGVTQPVSAASLPLPTGASTSANQPTNAAIGSTTSGQTGNLDLAAVTTGAPTYTTGQSDPLSLTTAGALRVDASATTQPVSGSVSLTGSTNNINNISGTVSLPTGAATSANQPTAAAAGSTSSGQTGNLAMGFATTANPTDTTADTYPLSLDTAGNLRAVDKADVAQGSTTGGQVGNLMQGAVTTSAPSYTTAQTSPLSLDTAGNLRVNVVTGGGSGGTSSSFSATFPSTGTAAGAEYLSSAPTLTTGQMVALQVTSAGSLHVTADNTNANGPTAASGSSPTVTQGQQASGSALSNNNPVLAGGSDGTDVRSLTTNASGDLVVVGTGTFAVQSAATLQAGSAVAGKFDLLGNAGGTLDTSAGSAASTGPGVQGLGVSAVPVAVSPPGVTAGNLVKGTTAAMTGTTSTQVIAAVSSQHIYVTSIHCNNSSATGTLVSIQDGSGGTTLDTLAAGATFGGDNRTGSLPLFWTTAGNGLYAADVTTGASVICQASGYSSAN